jgi:excisionase family DNA binding protein
MLLRIREVAAELGLAAKTVRKWILTGKLPAVKLGREWRVESEELAIFIARRRLSSF